jgi:hypothetical protein
VFESFPFDNGSNASSETVRADYYPIDGCVHISRKKTMGDPQNPDVHYGNDQDIWVIDPLHTQMTKNDPAPEPQGTAAKSNLSDVAQNEARSSARKKPLQYEESLSQVSHHSNARLMRVGMFQTNCLNPHPGKFAARNEQMNACTVKVWRTFSDGCVHYQMYNACNGQWDPKVNWTACVAQHHP